MVTGDECYNIEKEVIDKMFIEILPGEESLTTEKKEFLRVMYKNPGASLRELAQLTECNHQKTVRRMLKRIWQKLARYEDEYQLLHDKGTVLITVYCGVGGKFETLHNLSLWT